MFGAILSGRFPATNCVQVDENRFVLVIEASNVPQGGPNDHLTIFLFEPSLPDDYGATIHWHKTQGSDEWVYLGFLNNLKPSSHFRATSLTTGLTNVNSDAGIELGFSIEHMSAVEETHTNLMQQRVHTGAVPEINDFVEFATKVPSILDAQMLQMFSNTMLSFAAPSPFGEIIPVQAFTKWYESFMNKIQVRTCLKFSEILFSGKTKPLNEDHAAHAGQPYSSRLRLGVVKSINIHQ